MWVVYDFWTSGRGTSLLKFCIQYWGCLSALVAVSTVWMFSSSSGSSYALFWYRWLCFFALYFRFLRACELLSACLTIVSTMLFLRDVQIHRTLRPHAHWWFKTQLICKSKVTLQGRYFNQANLNNLFLMELNWCI